MKEAYIQAETEVITFTISDVITTSREDGETEPLNPKDYN